MHPNPCLSLLAVLPLLLASPLAGAAAQRTFVASYGAPGNTAFNCSVTKPCRAFSEAIGVTSAGGEVIVLDSAGYGPVTITKSVSLIAPVGIYAGITVFNGDGIIVDAPAATVVLRGLSINGQGGDNGINLLQADRLRIESCVISKMAVDGVMFSATGSELIVIDTIVRDNGGSGLGGDVNDTHVVLDHVRSEHNQTNGFYMASLSGEARAMISDSIFAFNGSNGIWVASIGSQGLMSAQIERSVLADNGANGLRLTTSVNSATIAAATRNAIHRNALNGIVATGPGSPRVTVSENTFLNNAIDVSADGSDTVLHASANSVLTVAFGGGFVQSNGASFQRYGNNVGYFTTTGTFGLQPGF